MQPQNNIAIHKEKRMQVKHAISIITGEEFTCFHRSLQSQSSRNGMDEEIKQKKRNCKYLHIRNLSRKKLVFQTLLACSDVALLVASLAKTARDFWLLSAVFCISEPTIVPSYSEGKQSGNQQYF